MMKTKKNLRKNKTSEKKRHRKIVNYGITTQKFNENEKSQQFSHRSRKYIFLFFGTRFLSILTKKLLWHACTGHIPHTCSQWVGRDPNDCLQTSTSCDEFKWFLGYRTTTRCALFIIWSSKILSGTTPDNTSTCCGWRGQMESRVGWRCLGRPIRNGYARPKGDAVRFALTTHLVMSRTENELRPIRSGANTFFFLAATRTRIEINRKIESSARSHGSQKNCRLWLAFA